LNNHRLFNFPATYGCSGFCYLLDLIKFWKMSWL